MLEMNRSHSAIFWRPILKSLSGLLVSGAAVSGSAVAATAPAGQEIPAAFQGNWHEGENETCVAENHGLLQIAPRNFSYPMSYNDRLRIQQLTPGSIRISFSSLQEGASSAKKSAEIWTLADNERHLRIKAVGASTPVNNVIDLYRCVPSSNN